MILIGLFENQSAAGCPALLCHQRNYEAAL